MSIRFGIAAAAVALLSAPALAQELVAYDSVGVWNVMVDPSIGNGCLIAAVFEDGSDVRIGFQPDAGAGYLLAMNDAWGDIVEGDVYPIQMDVDGQVYEGEGVGVYVGGMPGVDILFDNVDFLMDVALQQTLTLINESGPVMAIDLTDSHAALESAIACQQAQ
jgi:hypothetical protein